MNVIDRMYSHIAEATLSCTDEYGSFSNGGFGHRRDGMHTPSGLELIERLDGYVNQCVACLQTLLFLPRR